MAEAGEHDSHGRDTTTLCFPGKPATLDCSHLRYSGASGGTRTPGVLCLLTREVLSPLSHTSKTSVAVSKNRDTSYSTRRPGRRTTVVTYTPDNLIGTPDRTRTCIFHPVTRYGLEDRDDTEANFVTMRSSRLTDSNG